MTLWVRNHEGIINLHLDGSFNASEFGVLFSLLVLIMCACRYGCLKQSVKLRNFKKCLEWRLQTAL